MEEAPRVLRVIEERVDIDRVVDAVHGPVRGFMDRYPGVRAALDGSWLGHPLHPALIPFPIGAWATTLVLDIAGSTKNQKVARVADKALGFGLVVAIPTAFAGLVEWSYLEPGERRRVGFVHASANFVATTLLVSSFFLRKAGLRGAGVAFSVLGFGVAGFGAWLGSELAYRYRAGVDRFSSDQPRSLGPQGRVEEEGVPGSASRPIPAG
jgi:uncharacterized membrane protein